MFSSVRDFFTRHRRKFVVTGVVIGGAYCVIRYVQRKLIELQERQAREFVEKSRRINHFDSTERTCNQVIIGLSSELYQAIIRECNMDDIIEQLRSNPPDKLKLWEDMKIISFTRLTSFIYASSMLVIALRVQLNLLGGYLYRDIITEQKQISDLVKQQYLSLIRHFIHDGGLAVLVQLIYSKVLLVMSTLPLSKELNLADIEQLFWSLQMAINGDKADPIAKMSKYLMPEETPDHSAPLLQKMYNETLDMLESDDASSVCSNNVCRGFSLAVDAMAESLAEHVKDEAERVRNAQTNGEADSSDSAGDEADNANKAVHNNNSMPNISRICIPLAKIIPIVSGLTSTGCDTVTRPQNLATSLATFYVRAEKSKILGANVYEAFSSAV